MSQGGRQENEIIEVFTTKKALTEKLKSIEGDEHVDEVDEKGKMTAVYRHAPDRAITVIYQILH